MLFGVDLQIVKKNFPTSRVPLYSARRVIRFLGIPIHTGMYMDLNNLAHSGVTYWKKSDVWIGNCWTDDLAKVIRFVAMVRGLRTMSAEVVVSSPDLEYVMSEPTYGQKQEEESK